MRLPQKYCIHATNHEPCRFAAEELGAYLTAISGCTPSGSGYPIEIQCSGENDSEAFRICVTPEGTTLSSPSPRGCVYAVYAFLEEVVGCRFLAEDCEVLPPSCELQPWDRAYQPAFAYREVYFRGALDGRFALKRGLNSARAQILPAWGGKTMFYNYSHTFEQLVPPEEWFDSHPEYFSMIDGERRREQSQLCLTNPDVLRLCIDRVRQWMREHPECRIFSVAQNDWYGYCQCPACRAVDEAEGSHAGSLLRFVNAVADAIREEFPQNRIHTFAYLYGRKAPRLTRPRDNVIIRLCNIESCMDHPIEACAYAVPRIDVLTATAGPFEPCGQAFLRDLRDWSGMAHNLYIWDYAVNFAHYLLPFPNLAAAQRNLQLFRDCGVTGVFEQGNYAPGAASAFCTLKIYVLSRLLWNPDEPIERLVRTFVEGYFSQEAAPEVMTVLAITHQAVANAHMSLYDQPDAPYLDEEWLQRADSHLAAAQAQAPGQPYRDRIARERLSYAYALLTRLTMDAPGRSQRLEQFAQEVRRLDIRELFERRALEPSLAALEKARYGAARGEAPYQVYRL